MTEIVDALLTELDELAAAHGWTSQEHATLNARGSRLYRRGPLVATWAAPVAGDFSWCAYAASGALSMRRSPDHESTSEKAAALRAVLASP